MEKQTTIEESVRVHGVNIISGEINWATFHPAEADTGLVFIVKNKKINATLENAEYYKGRLSSLIGIGKDVMLVEHLLSAVYALKIDNLYIELSDGVCPTTDNCAAEYFLALKNRRKEQDAPKILWQCTSGGTVTNVGAGDDQLYVLNRPGFCIKYSAFYPIKLIGEQHHAFEVSEENYEKEIMDARPVGFINGIPDLFGRLVKSIFIWTDGLVHGVNDKNYLMITSNGAEKYANPKEYDVRYDGQEFVRHKVLDVMGTLALTGRQFKNTEFSFYKTGHEFDLDALHKLFNMGCFSDYHET